MNPDPSGDSRVSLHCPTSQTSWMGTILPEWGLFWSQCAIVLDRTHIWDTPLRLHCGAVMAGLAQVEDLCTGSISEGFYTGSSGFLATLDTVFGWIWSTYAWFVNEKDGFMLPGSPELTFSRCHKSCRALFTSHILEDLLGTNLQEKTPGE